MDFRLSIAPLNTGLPIRSRNRGEDNPARLFCVLTFVCLSNPRVQVLRAGFDRRSLWETRMTREIQLDSQ